MKSRLNTIQPIVASVSAFAFATSAHAVDYTWGGGNGNWNSGNWSDGTNSGLTGPVSAGNTATINSGVVTANVGGPGNLDSIIIGSGGQLNLYNGDGGIYAYQGISNLNLQGGTLNGGSGTYNAYGASFLGNVTVSGTSASTITGASWFNVGNNTYTVADVTGNAATDLLVSTSLRGPAGSPDWTYTSASITKEGAGTMEITSHSYFWGGLTLNGGTLKLSGGNGGYGFFAGAVNVNAGTTLEISSDGTGLGWQGGWKPASVNINGGTITTSGANHVWGISGGVNLTGGTLQSNNGVSATDGAQLEWNHTSVTTNASDITSEIGGRIRIRNDGGYSSIAFTVANGDAVTDLLVSAAVTEAAGGMGISKSGSGLMELSGTSNYTGATSVSAGTLLVTGALGNTAVTVDGGAFGGTGTIGGSLTINSGFFHVADLADSLAVAGTVSLFAGFGIDDLTGIDWGSVGNGTYTLISGTLGSGVFSGLSNNSSGTAFSLGGGRSAYFQEGSLQLVVIPEPGVALLGGFGLLAMLRRRRA